jgi:hypothetical protein
LRPCTTGGSGWEWFATLRLEAVTLPLALTDPLLGQSWANPTLLSARPLLDWSVT